MVAYKCLLLMLTASFSNSYGAINDPYCNDHWKTVDEAYSQITSDCLRLSTCGCDSGSCGNNVTYKVTTFSRQCTTSNLISWCDWDPWQVQIRKYCYQISKRFRKCCVYHPTEIWYYPWIKSSEKRWQCPGKSEEEHIRHFCRDEDDESEGISPLIIFAVVICILIFITLLVLAKILCGVQIDRLCIRICGFCAPEAQRSENNQVTPSAIDVPPSYDDIIMNGTPPPPCYEEAMENNMSTSDIALTNVLSANGISNPTFESDSCQETAGETSVEQMQTANVGHSDHTETTSPSEIGIDTEVTQGISERK